MRDGDREIAAKKFSQFFVRAKGQEETQILYCVYFTGHGTTKASALAADQDKSTIAINSDKPDTRLNFFTIEKWLYDKMKTLDTDNDFVLFVNDGCYRQQHEQRVTTFGNYVPIFNPKKLNTCVHEKSDIFEKLDEQLLSKAYNYSCGCSCIPHDLKDWADENDNMYLKQNTSVVMNKSLWL